VVTAYLKSNGIDVNSKHGKAAHSNLCAKLAEADWLAALNDYLQTYTAAKQSTANAGMWMYIAAHGAFMLCG
jgi:hypothetical protein